MSNLSLPQQSHTGLAFAIFAVASFSLQAVVLREISYAAPPAAIVFLRSVFTLVFLVPYLAAGISAGASVRPELPLLARAVLIGASMYFATIAVGHIAIVDFTLLQSTEAMFIFVIGALLLGERTRTVQWLSLLVGLVGTYVVLAPRLEGGHAVFGLFALASAALMACATALLRVGRHRWHLAQVLLWQNLTCIALFAWPGFQALPAVSTDGLLLVGVLSGLQALAQLAFGQAVRLAAISLIAPMFLARLVFGALFGFLFYQEIPSVTTVLGSIIICLSVATTMAASKEAPIGKA